MDQHHTLSIETRERVIKSVAAPQTKKPTNEEFYVTDPYGTVKPNADFLKSHFFREGRLHEDQALFILHHATELLRQEPNIAEVRSPVTICGDIHGQYYDLMKIFEIGGVPRETTYLWLGDYVDRGNFGIECLLYLYALKLWHPKTFTMLRGNHECRHLTEYFTFKRECLHKYSVAVYEACLESFCALPVAATVDGRFFCVHGGLSPELLRISDVDKVNRFTEPGSTGLLCDLLWSDPVPNFGYEQESTGTSPPLPPGTTYLPNPLRGCSYLYTYEAACQFLERNNLLGIIRGHEAQDAGYTMHKKTPTKKFPSVITIFSAPNYCDCYHNRGAVLKYANKNITIRQYNSSAHPFWLPNFMDAFTWSLPFVGSKITEMLLAILSICSEEELAADDEEDKLEEEVSAEEAAARREAIKRKILALGRMQRIFQVLRDEAENATELAAEEGYPPEHRKGNLTVQKPAIKNFADARRSDSINERLPQFNPEPSTSPSVMFPVPSMRRATVPDGSDHPMNMEELIKRTLDQEADPEGDMVGMIAERLASRRRVTPPPKKALKRHETSQL